MSDCGLSVEIKQLNLWNNALFSACNLCEVNLITIVNLLLTAEQVSQHPAIRKAQQHAAQ